jgi:hypothetical protein
VGHSAQELQQMVKYDSREELEERKRSDLHMSKSASKHSLSTHEGDNAESESEEEDDDGMSSLEDDSIGNSMLSDD